MATIPFNKLEKMTIIPYSKSENGSLSAPGKKYTVMYNPSTLSIQRSQTLESKPLTAPKNPPEVETKYPNGSSFNVELFFDGTGASPSPGGINGLGIVSAIEAFSGKVVAKQIEKFFKTTLDQNSPTHESNYLKVSWGDLLFPCKLHSANINYLLFDNSGNPLRATISASFVEVPDNGSSIQKKMSSFFSPDITKTHTVKAGDTIYNIAKNEYDDESYYLQIAQANDLKNYRRLKPGMQLILPPIKKDE